MRFEQTDPEAHQKVRDLFSNLRAGGFWARLGSPCCNTCSWSLIQHEADEGQPVAFVHDQGMEGFYAAGLGGGLCIGFGIAGTRDRADEEYERVGEVVAESARAVGLEVEWDGTAGMKVIVKPATFESKAAAAIDRVLS